MGKTKQTMLRKRRSKKLLRSTLNSLVTQSNFWSKRNATRKFLMMKKKRKRRKKRKMLTKKRTKRRKRQLRKNTPKMKSLTKPSQSGPETQMTSAKKNTENSTNHSPTIGKNILLSSTSQLKDNLNSVLFSSSQNELPSICSKTRRPKTTSSFMSEEFLSWTTAKNSSLNISTSSRVLLTPKISH